MGLLSRFFPKSIAPALPRSILVFSKDAAIVAADRARGRTESLIRTFEAYDAWMAEELPGVIDDLTSGQSWAYISNHWNGTPHSRWICDKTIRTAFAKEMFDVGIVCVYHNSNDEMESAEEMMLRFRTWSDFKFNKSNLDDPLCPDSLDS